MKTSLARPDVMSSDMSSGLLFSRFIFVTGREPVLVSADTAAVVQSF